MGDPRRLRKKYSTPRHPWQRDRIEDERILIKEYGLKNKKELWKMSSLLRNFTNHAKRLANTTGPQAEREKEELLLKLKSMGLIEGKDLNEVLSVTTNAVLERRLETIVFRMGKARSIAQARQFIVHEHILVNGKSISLPSYLVSKADEAAITFNPSSSLVSDEHPERVKLEKKSQDKPEEKREKRDNWGKPNRHRREGKPRAREGRE